MDDATIRIKDGQDRYQTGEVVSGSVEVILPAEAPIAPNVTISFNCIGEVKWSEYPGSPYYLDGCVYYEEVNYHEEVLDFSEADIQVQPHGNRHKKALIPFSFTIPKDKNLPSTMISTAGIIQYYVGVVVKDQEETKKFIKEIIVQSPIEKNLMITVGGSAEKVVLLHGGKVGMHASIGRKGFAPGEKITVHLSIDNKTNTRIVPRVTLYQVQIYMSGVRHKTIESILTDEPVVGEAIEPHQEHKETLLVVKIPSDESLSIKSSVITVKYFVHVTLDIPHSFDLHVNLPIVVTSRRVIEQIQEQGDTPNLISSNSSSSSRRFSHVFLDSPTPHAQHLFS